VRGRAFLASIGAALLWLAALAPAAAEDTDPFRLADTQLEPVKWADLERRGFRWGKAAFSDGGVDK